MGALIGSLLPTLLPGIMDIIKRVIPDPVKQAQVQQEVTQKIIDAQQALVNSSRDVMVADAGSDSKYAANARPTVVYWSMACITFIAILGAFDAAGPVIAALQAVPAKFWDLMTYGIGAFVLGRSLEKGAKHIGVGLSRKRE